MAEKEDVIIFLEEVRNHLYGDLENFTRLCEEAEVKEGSNPSCGLTTTSQTTLSPNFKYQEQKESLFYRSTIPHILSVFSTIDLVGFLLGNSSVRSSKLDEKFTTFFCNTLNDKEISCLTLFYRNGMSHTFFPKKRFGISAHSSNKDNLFLVEGETIVLNANYLIDLTKKRVDIILKDLTLISNMEKQFKELENYDKNEIKKREMNLESFIKELKNHKS